MADQGSIANLKQNIDDNIYQNTDYDITGGRMNTILQNIVDTLEFNGRDFFNVNEYREKSDEYADAAAGRAAVPDEVKKIGLVITYLLADGWYIDQFIGSNISGWGTASNWKVLGPVTISQNANTGHTEINIGSNSYPVASVDDVEGNTVKAPYFTNGFITTSGTYMDDDDYRCSSFLPCDLIESLLNETDSTININYYDENKVHQFGATLSLTNHKLYISRQYKYFRYWALSTKINNTTIVWNNSLIEPLNTFKMAKRYGNLMPFGSFDKTSITGTVGSGTTSVSVKGMLYAKKTDAFTYLNVSDATFDIPQTANLVVFGVIYNPNSATNARYGYWSISTQSVIADNELFEPIAVCRVYQSEFKIFSGFINETLLGFEQKDDFFNKMLKYRGGSLLIFTSVDKSFLTASVGSTNTDVIIKQMVFGYRQLAESPSFYTVANQATLSIPNDANLVIIGVIYKANGSTSARYGYYSTNGGSTSLNDDEYFEPLVICRIYDGSCTFLGGQLYERICAIENEKMANSSKQKPSNIIYVNDFDSVSDLGALKISDGTGAIPANVLSLVQNGIEISQDYAFWPRIDSRINNCVTRILFNTANSGSFIVRSYGMEDGAQGLQDKVADCDITNGTISLYEQTPVSYSFNANSDYWVEIHRIDKKITLSMVEVKTGTRTEIGIFMGNTTQNLCLLYDIIAVGSNDANSIIVKSYRIESGVDKPRLMIYGDSITVGFTATMAGGINANCYAYKVGEASGMKWLSSGRGGGIFDGLLGGHDLLGFYYKGRMEVELSKLRPDYVMITMGTNGGGTYAQYKAVIEKILEYGATPILNKLPIRASTDHIHNEDYIVSANAVIEHIWKEYGINGAHFDLATSLNNDGDTINTNMFIDDYIHPNDAGHLAMYQRVLIDCPYLFLQNQNG